MSTEIRVQGLNEFLEHIQKHPFNDTLIMRFHSLIKELPHSLRRASMQKLLGVLLDANPHNALRSCYVYLQDLRQKGADPEEEIFALKLTQDCFRKLGKPNHLLLIHDEISRLEERVRKERNTSISEQKSLERSFSSIASEKSRQSIVPQPPNEAPGNAYEESSRKLFLKFKEHLGNFPQIRNQRLAASTLIKAYDMLYQTMAGPLTFALKKYGCNPLLWAQDGNLQPDLKKYLLESRLFHMGRDRQTEARMRMCLEILTAYHDQKLMLPSGSPAGNTLGLRSEMLQEVVLSILDTELRAPRVPTQLPVPLVSSE